MRTPAGTRGQAAGPHPAAYPTPTLRHQVLEARRAGPGPLEFCPLHPGKSRALYMLDLPGLPTGTGWCETSWKREKRVDIITFRMHWDARRYIHRSGTFMLRYAVNRPTSPSTPLSVRLVGQSGPLPP